LKKTPLALSPEKEMVPEAQAALDVGPEFGHQFGYGVIAERHAQALGVLPDRTAVGIIGRREGNHDGIARDLGNVKARLAAIGTGDEDAGSRVGGAMPKCSPAQAEKARVFVQQAG
jgi:hypothetical protein